MALSMAMGSAPDLMAAEPDAVLLADAGNLSEVQEVIVTGTRQKDIRAADSAAPIQIISAETVEKTASSPDLIQTLTELVPSLEATTYGGDLSNVTLQARLRGLSPNDTLVLVNGKRRHTTANLNVGGGGFGGGAAADLNLIPVDAIDHVEVLTDGAAAQYGSDAIAGVINIILKKNFDGGKVSAEYGGYQDGGGQTADFRGSTGFQPYEGAFLNFSAEFRNVGRSYRGTVDPRVLDLTGINANMQYVPGYPYLNLTGGNGGSAEQQNKIASFNSGFALADGLELYAFGTYGRKGANALQNYRTPSQVSYTVPGTSPAQIVYPYPYGFSPREEIQENDYGATGGIKGAISEWSWDLSSSYGRDWVDVYTRDSTNTSLYALNGIVPPSDYYDGSFKATQWTNSLDINRDFAIGLAGPLNVAFGGEYRRDTYAIFAGSPGSYFGVGATAYPGFKPVSAGIHSRTDRAVYVDLAAKITDKFRLDVAGHYEDYSDFGDKVVGKITGRYDFNPAIALRGTVSTGFRAPNLAEEWYTTTSVSPTTATVRLAPNSTGAVDLGLGSGLGPETSRNYSLGLVLRPIERLTASLDVYQIDLNDRIVGSAGLNSSINGVIVSPAITQAIIDNGNTLDPTVVASGSTSVSLSVNGFDSTTRGADLAIDYRSDFGAAGQVDWSAAANFNTTTVDNVRPGPAQIGGQPLIDAASISTLTAYPKFVANAGALWSLRDVTINLREVVYGSGSAIQGDAGATAKLLHSATPYITYFTSSTGVIPITNVDLSYNAAKSVRLSVGGVNVFDRYPDKLNSSYLAALRATKSASAGGWYPSFSPFGIQGGYWYVRGEYSF